MSKIVCAKMEKHEAVAIVGARRFSSYKGYSNKTVFAGRYDDTQPIDEQGRIDRVFVAIDALRLKPIRDQIFQFYKNSMLRELNKAYVGFKGDRYEDTETRRKVTTGKWGCGAYNGNPELKFCLQWIAASANNREMNFTTFNEQDCKNLIHIFEMYKGKTISDLFKDLVLLREYVRVADQGEDGKQRLIKNKKQLTGILYRFLTKDKSE